MIGDEILTIGVDYRNPRGGIAMVENSYSRIYTPFKHITTGGGKNLLSNIIILFNALVQFLFYLPSIKIVHIHAASNKSFWRKSIFIYIARSIGKKVVFHCHGGQFKLFDQKHHNAIFNTLSKCDCIVALSESWKQWFIDTYKHPNVVVIDNIIDYPIFEAKGVNDRGRKPLKFLYLGLIGQNKGIYDLIEVIKQNKDLLKSNLKLLIGGNGELDKLKNLIEVNELSELVEYMGWISGEAKTKILSSADVFILPSYNEGLPISILEAMSYKLPIISTTVGGIPEIVEDGKNGFLFKPGDKEEMYRLIHKLILDDKLRVSMGEVSHMKAISHLPSNVDKELQLLYDNLLADE